MDWQSAFDELEAATVETFGEPVLIQREDGKVLTVQVAFDTGSDVDISRQGRDRKIPVKSSTLVGLAKRSSLPDDFENWTAIFNGQQWSLSEGENEEINELWLVLSPRSETNGQWIRD